MGGVQPSHMLEDMPTMTSHNSVPNYLIDESAFDDDVVHVMDIVMWKDMHLEGMHRRRPFKRWIATGSPVDDLSWLA